MKLRVVVEIIVFYAAVAAVNYFIFPQYPGFIGIDPHPYWLGVLLFGFRYGVLPGLISGIFSAGLYLGFAWTGAERYIFEDASFYLLPSLFMIVGVVIGVGVYQYRQRIDELDTTCNARKLSLKQASEENRTLADINAGLEKRIVTRMQTMITLYEGARSLSIADMEALYPAVLHFTMKSLEAGEAAIYVWRNNAWHLKVNEGWKAYENYPAVLQKGEGLTGLAGDSGKIVTIRDFVGANAAGNILTDCMMAGPIRNGEKGEVVAVLSIQDIPFLNFTSASVSLFGFLLEWASRSVGQALQLAALREGEIWDPTFQVFSYRYFESRLNQEWLRSKTYYLPLSLGLVNIEGVDTLPQAAEDQLLQIVAQVLRSSCREVDVIARYTRSDIPFAFLLITASPAQAEDIRQKITTNLDRLHLADNNPAYAKLRFHVGMSHFTPQTRDITALLHTAQEALS